MGECSTWHTNKPGFDSNVGASRLIPHTRGIDLKPYLQTTWSEMNSPFSNAGLERSMGGRRGMGGGGWPHSVMARDHEVSPGSDMLLYWEGCEGEVDITMASITGKSSLGLRDTLIPCRAGKLSSREGQGLG